MPDIAGIHYREYYGGISKRTPIILVHGAGLDSRIWSYSLRRLDGFRVFSIDLPGHGRSPGTCCHSAWSYANALVDFMNRLEIIDAVFVGLGIGGSIVMDLGARFPDRVCGLFLINTCLQYFIPFSVVRSMRESQYVSSFKHLVNFGMNGNVREQVKVGLEAIVNSQRQSVLAADLYLVEQHRIQHVSDRIADIPRRFLFSEGDRLLGKDHLESMRDFLSEDHSYISIANRGHWLPFEDPQCVRSHLMTFIHDLELD